MDKNNLREVRTKLGLSQLQLSFLSRVPNCVISDFERGVRAPWPKAKRALAQALRIPQNEIFPKKEIHKSSMQNYSVNNLKGQATDIIAEALKAAEMRQSCTDYGYYAEILLKQVEPIIFKYAPNNNADKST